MRNISFKFAVNTQLTILGLVTLFHLSIILGLIPGNIVWGGKFQNPAELMRMELISILVNILIIFIIAMKAGYIKSLVPVKFLNILLWLFVLLFALNTIGNLFAESLAETLIFTPLTLISSLLCFRIVSNKND